MTVLNRLAWFCLGASALAQTPAPPSYSYEVVTIHKAAPGQTNSGFGPGAQGGLRDAITTQRPVIDRTGLTGECNFDMEFAPFDATADSSAPSLFTALEQLGLRLETTKAPLAGMVIDKAERPGANGAISFGPHRQ